jgi:hypothetical protein
VVDDLVGTLAQDAIAITRRERGAMLVLVTQMNLEGDLVPRALATCPETGGHERRSVWALVLVNDGSGWTCAATAVTFQPVRSSRAAPRKASDAMASASATSVVRTVSAMVART